MKNNHTLLGLHLRGNAMHIDCRGFLQHGSAKTPHTLNIGGQTDSRGMASEISGDRFRFTFDDSCWLCDGWTEQTFYALLNQVRRIGDIKKYIFTCQNDVG